MHVIGDAILKKVKEELNVLGINCEDLILEKVSNEIYFYKCYCDEDIYVVKYYNCDNYQEIINRYKLMEKSGIIPLHFIVENRLVFYDSLCDSYLYRCLSEEDLNDTELIKNIYYFYKRVSDVFEYKEDEIFSKNNLVKIMNKFNLIQNESFVYIYNNFENIKLKINRYVKPCIINCFSLESLMVCRNSKNVFCTCFDNVKLGNEFSLFKSFCEYFNKGKNELLYEFEETFKEDEKVSSFIHQVFLDLLFSNDLNDAAKCSLNNVYNGLLMEKCKCLVEWY